MEIDLRDISEEMLYVSMTKKGPGSLRGKRRVMFFSFYRFCFFDKRINHLISLSRNRQKFSYTNPDKTV